MLSEQITVTTTPTSIRALIAAARGVAVDAIPDKCVGIMLRYGVSETELITLTDNGQGGVGASVNGAVILDAANETLLAVGFRQFAIGKALLNCDTGTVTVHIIIEQTL